MPAPEVLLVGGCQRVRCFGWRTSLLGFGLLISKAPTVIVTVSPTGPRAGTGYIPSSPPGKPPVRSVAGWQSEKLRSRVGQLLVELGVLPLSRHVNEKSHRGEAMKATQKLYDAGQSLWLDNITRDLLTSGTLKRYIDELSITGLTSNPTIFDHAIKHSSAYDMAIRERMKAGKSGEG